MSEFTGIRWTLATFGWLTVNTDFSNNPIAKSRFGGIRYTLGTNGNKNAANNEWAL